jgi:hypothetical protein
MSILEWQKRFQINEMAYFRNAKKLYFTFIYRFCGTCFFGKKRKIVGIGMLHEKIVRFGAGHVDFFSGLVHKCKKIDVVLNRLQTSAFKIGNLFSFVFFPDVSKTFFFVVCGKNTLSI